MTQSPQELHIRQTEDSSAHPIFTRKGGTPLYDEQAYKDEYATSIDDKEAFWARHAARLSWIRKWDKVKDTSYDGDIGIKWFEGGQLNVAYNCIDRHLEDKRDNTAIIWEPDDPQEEAEYISYGKLHEEVCRFANTLKEQGVRKGDVVTIYMPMIPQAAYAMLACARIGAAHSVVFGGFSPQALRGRIADCKSRFIITADEGVRGGKRVPLKANVDAALEEADDARVLVVRNTGGDISWTSRDVWYHEASANAATQHEPEVMEAEDPLFILYTSGSTGTPKGVMHTSAGYLLYASLTHEVVFDNQEGDIYWCTADIGWITGHSYIIYGPLANGGTTLMFEGVPTHPTPARCWEVIERHKVNVFYTAPTAVRALMARDPKWLENGDRSSLRILGSVGEPINPEAWRWYFENIGESRCPIVDTWWQTETGGFLITPLPYATRMKEGSATLPFFGVEPVILDENGEEIDGEGEGFLCIRDSWPGQMRTVYGNHERFKDVYFSRFPGYYFSGDTCRRDKDGYYWIIGRADDVINVSGHRLGTAEVESALVEHSQVAEAAVVGVPHEIKGQGIHAFVTLTEGTQESEALREELVQLVRAEIGAFARPEVICFTPALPKTRSGKIMRRILRKIAGGETSDFGDTNTLLNPEAVEEIIKRTSGA